MNKEQAISILQDRIREVNAYNFDPQVWKNRTQLDVQQIFGRYCEQWLQVGQLYFDTYIVSEKQKKMAEGKATAIKLLQSYIEYINQTTAIAAQQRQESEELYKQKYSKLLGEWNEFVPQYNQLLKDHDNLIEQYNTVQGEKETIEQEVQQTKKVEEYFPIQLLDNTRGYLITTGNQCNFCFNHGLNDACLVMLRKLIETLIIECFERHRIEGKIKNQQGHYFFLSDLIDLFTQETAWTTSRNTISSLPSIKKLGDLSAHNRRFNAKRHDLEKIQGEVRIVIEELVHLIDYPTWTK
ncbi:hypothetical protein ESA94_09755 [Lacibacter luteus]|uniref:DUF4145 domain-containing protein n=1 Tax=Lacibacter luteus TaxID=2508719 RepID=A0A4Q1CK35_9BACT|nr:hypothetical protein [Lacibacter luteus]RXK60738.1 hypothetical protein ESA94_09755 [Lacibacter luteus]